MAEDNNYVLGKGKLYFSRLISGTQNPEGYRFIGDCKEFNITFASTKLDHFSSTSGVKVKDKSVVLEVNRTGTIVTEEISSENLALFFFGSSGSLTVAGATVTAEPIADVILDRYYPLGVSSANPGGARGVTYPGSGGTAFVVKKGVTVLTAGTDYAWDPIGCLLHILPGGTLVAGDDITVGYTTVSTTREQVLSGTAAVEGALIYKSDNAEGANQDYAVPYVSLSPNGDYALISDTWLALSFSVEVLSRTGWPAVTVDGRPL